MTTSVHTRLVRYLAATGWLPPEDIGQLGGLWRHVATQDLLPVPNQLNDEGLDWSAITQRLAQIERSPVVDVVARLNGFAVDIANLRAANDIVIKDTIPYGAGMTLVKEGWAMFRSSATTALGPKSFIRKYRRDGDEILATARMAQTRRGSYIIPIYLPLPEDVAPPVDEPHIEGLHMTATPEPMQRRVMRTFAECLAALDILAIQPEREPSSDDVHDLIRAGVSHQFAAALQRLLVDEAVAEFSSTFEWAPSGGPAPQNLGTVSIPAAASQRIKSVAAKLRSVPSPRVEEQFVGPISRVQRDPDGETGVVTLQTVRNKRSAHVSVPVTAEVLDQAWGWARDHKTLVIESRVRRTGEGLMADVTDAVSPLMLDTAPE
ncbi:hypothetical protein [Rhodococcoides fascians]|uniref:hypothetical protein n=1 Tax=Rhodococcoides fascians TaxID=1828 RepID=UPI000563148C|nr:MULTISPECIES: hypothetical protein [Rhodococcus]OZF01336.1 hypothetical protein CH301_11410 [Rhodococcus sp. 15-1189-1-1a]OZF15506.1 hypothetical protein CH299_11960 [Rhodococcus sp. 14-2686-1-2]